jgi:DnaJ-class molecular chaperone
MIRSYPTEVVDCPQCHGMGEIEDDLWVWTRCYSCFGQGEIEVCAYCLESGDDCDVCQPSTKLPCGHDKSDLTSGDTVTFCAVCSVVA